jgi:hypothetical protein
MARSGVAPAAIAILLAAVSGSAAASTPLAAQWAQANAGSGTLLGPGARLCSRTPHRRRYVSTNGSNANPGTRTHPWRTIARALRGSQPGDAIYVRSGTYPDWAVQTGSGTAAAPISLRAYPGEHPVYTGRLKVEGDYFCVKGFNFQGRTSANASSVLIYVSGAKHVEIAKNRIQKSFMSGIYVGDEGDLSSDVNIIANYIVDNGTHDRFDHGVYFGHGSGGLVANNVVLGNIAVGLKIAPEANHVIVTQNTVVHNGFNGIIVGGELRWSSNDNLIVNNVVVDNAGWGIRSYWEQSVGSGNLALRNLVFANAEGPFWFPGGGLLERESIRANPRFVSANNYRLKANSPAIGRAIRAYSMRADFAGRARARRGAPDLGAYER